MPLVHIRTDDEELNSKRKFACGIGPELPEGDTYYFYSEAVHHHKISCPGCIPFKREFGTPLSKLSGRPGQPGYELFCSISKSWGYY